jgi:PAS domain-containing protein
MEQKETLLDDLFQEFQSLLEQSDPEEKEHLATRFYSWAEQQADALGIRIPSHTTEDEREDRDPVELQNLVASETHLRQIAENIEQVVWLQDLNSDRILYVSPAFEKVWGRSGADLYADPMILIESVHPEAIQPDLPDYSPRWQLTLDFRPFFSYPGWNRRTFQRDLYCARYQRPETDRAGAAENPGPHP